MEQLSQEEKCPISSKTTETQVATELHKTKSLEEQTKDEVAFTGPLKGNPTTRDNRDMSEGLQNSRSQKLGLVNIDEQ